MATELVDSATDEKWEKMKLPYQLIKQITNDFNEGRIVGIGAFGTVYKGVFANGEEIAVKVLHNKIPGFDGEEIQREFRNLRKLKHQNVVELVGYCDESEEVLVEYEGKQVVAQKMHTALCFEYVHNGSLHSHITGERTGLDWHTRYKIIKGICEGLKYLRGGLDSSSLWHLDLKPDNILLNYKMIPKIADFGLSRLLVEEKTRKTITICGTFGYCPPEYIQHQVISKEYDIFSLGVILVKIMIGYEGYKRIADMTPSKFVEHVLECWRKKLKPISTPESLEVYCNQVKRCIKIALTCLKVNRQERPTIQYIVSSLNETDAPLKKKKSLNETGSMIGDRGLQKQFDKSEPVPYSMRSITSGTSSVGKDQASRPSYKENMEYPTRITLNITDVCSNERLIGSGGTRNVYKVVHNGQFIAVKLFRQSKFIVHSLEVEVLRRSCLPHHPNFVKLVGYYQEDKVQHEYLPHSPTKPHGLRHPKRGSIIRTIISDLTGPPLQLAFCYEYMVNGSLQRHISDECSGLDWHLRYGIIKGTCLGIRYLHEELEDPIIHMELKPSKILLDESLIPKIGDFMFSRHEVERNFVKEPRVGSVEYMPPEFITKQVISKQYDIYSLGIVILEIITGNRKYPKSEEMSSNEFIEHVHKRWTDRLQATLSGTNVEIYRKQVKKCIEIALKCVEYERLKRPAIGDIVHVLNETETVELLDVHPPELCFPLEPKKASSCSLHLKNKGDDHVVFMLVAKNPTSYLSKLPLCGVVPPRCTYTVALTSRKQLGSKPRSESVEFIALRSVAVRYSDLPHVGQGSVTDLYDNCFKEAKEMTSGDEVQEVTLKALRDPPAAEGTACEPTQSMTIEIIATQNSQQVTSIDVHPTESWIMTTHHGGGLRFWNYQNMAILNSFEVTEEPVHAAKFIARKKWVVAGDVNGCILVYSYGEHEHVTSFNAHRNSITCLAAHPTRPFVLSSSHGDHLIKLWDWEKDWECTRTFQGDRGAQMTFNLDNTNDFASASSDGMVKIWGVDSDDGKTITPYGLCVGYFMRRDRQHLITGVKDGTAAQIWNMEMEAGCVEKLEGHTGRITIVHLHPELPLLITGSLDGTVSLWNSTTYKIENKIDFNMGAVYAFGYIKRLRRMVVGCQLGIAMVEIPLS